MYYIVTFAVMAVSALVAVIFWVRGLVKDQRSQESARNTMSTGFMIGIWGLVLAVILFGFFNL